MPGFVLLCLGGAVWGSGRLAPRWLTAGLSGMDAALSLPPIRTCSGVCSSQTHSQAWARPRTHM